MKLSSSAAASPWIWRMSTVFLALLFGFVCVLPNVWQRIDPVYPFAGIEMMGTDQEFYYAARIGQFLQGDIWITDPYTAAEPTSFVQPPLPEWIEGGLGMLLGLDTARTILAIKIVFGALLFAAMSIFFSRFSRKPWWSLFAVSVFLFAGFFFSAPQDLFSVITDIQFGGEFLRFSRPTNPLFSTLLFFLALIAFLSWAQKERKIGLVLAGILTGAAFYAYPYTWTYLGAIDAIACGIFLIGKKWKRLKEMLFMGLIIGLIAIPFFHHQYIISLDPAYGDVEIRYILLHARKVVGGLWMLIFLFLPTIPSVRRLFSPPWLLVALGGAGLVTMNQQVITNTMIVPQHYHWYYILPLAVPTAIIAFCVLCVQPAILRLCGKRPLILLSCGGIAVAVALGIRFQQLSFVQQRGFWGNAQSMAPVLHFLEDTVEPGVITFAWGFENELLPLYTTGDVFNASNAPMCLCTHERGLYDYLFRLWLSGLTFDEAEKTFFTSRRFEVSSNYRGTYYREAAGSYEGIPDEEVMYVLNAYRTFLSLTTEEKLTKYTLHYLVFPQAALSSLPRYQELLRFSDQIYDDGYFVVRKMRPPLSR